MEVAKLIVIVNYFSQFIHAGTSSLLTFQSGNVGCLHQPSPALGESGCVLQMGTRRLCSVLTV